MVGVAGRAALERTLVLLSLSGESPVCPTPALSPLRESFFSEHIPGPGLEPSESSGSGSEASGKPGPLAFLGLAPTLQPQLLG